jgi:hypothetical protein
VRDVSKTIALRNSQPVSVQQSTILSRNDEDEKADKVNDLNDFYQGDIKTRIRGKT